MSLFLLHFCCLVTNLCLTLCDPMDCSTPDSSVLCWLSGFARIHVHWVRDAMTISSSAAPFSSCLQSLPVSLPGFFPMSWLLTQGDQSIATSTSASVLPMNIQGWFPLGLTDLVSLQSKGLSRVFSNTTVKNINSSALSFPYSPTLTSIPGYWKNHSFDYMDLRQQSDVSAF